MNSTPVWVAMSSWPLVTGITTLTKAVSEAVRIPVIASGGAGSAQHFAEVFDEGHADAALAASIFHFGLSSISQLKQHLRSAAISVRWPC